MMTYWGSGGIFPRILNLGTDCKWEISPGRFTPPPHAVAKEKFP